MWLKKLWKRTANDADKNELKPIVYRGGLVRFRIPSTWTEEYEEKGGGLFFEDAKDSGTLRLNVMTFSSGDNVKPIDVDLEVKEKAKKYDGMAVILDEGNALVKYDREAVEAGENIKIRFWEVHNPVPPNHLRIAVFSYTLLAKQFDRPEFQQELDLLDHEVTSVQFATQLGETG